MSNNRALNIKLPEKLYNDLKQAAENKHISLAGLVRMVCSEWLEVNTNGSSVDDIDEIFNSLPGVILPK